MQKPQIVNVNCFPVMLCLEYHIIPRRRRHHDTTSAALQSFPFWAATTGAFAYVRVRGCARVRHPNILLQDEPGTHSQEEESIFTFYLLI